MAGKQPESKDKASVKFLQTLRNNLGVASPPPARDAQVDVQSQLILEQREHPEAMLAPPPATPALVEYDVNLEEDSVAVLAKGAESWVTNQQVRRRSNATDISNRAAEHLKNTPDEQVSDEPVDPDWTARFFTAAQDVSNEQMKVLWAKVLAGEVKQPGAFSLRCLDVLRNLTRKDAELFALACRFLASGSHVFQGGTILDNLVSKHIRFEDFMTLAEAELVSDTPVSITFHLRPVPTILQFRDHWLQVSAASGGDLRLGGYALTGAGKQLAPLVRAASDPTYVLALRDVIRASGFQAVVQRLIRVGDQVMVETKPLEAPPPEPASGG